MSSTYTDRIAGVETALAIKTPVRAATTANITLSGTQTIDGVALASGDRVLVKDQTDPAENGIYNVNTAAWSRAIDFNGARDVAQGTQVYVSGGSTLGGLIFAVGTASPVVGSALTFNTIISPSEHPRDVDVFFASTDTFTAGEVIQTRQEGFSYRATDTTSDVVNAGEQNFRIDRDGTVYSTTATIALTGASAITNLPGLSIKQADSAELSNVVTASFSAVSDPNDTFVDLFIDGNRDNNTAAVIGYQITEMKRARNRHSIGVVNCDTGIYITDNVEYGQFDLSADYCGTGVLIDTDDSTTPDELLMRVSAHECDTFFEASGTNKMTGHVIFGCEQSNSWGAVFSQGWWQIEGLLRGVGKTSGGGLQISGGASVRGDIEIAGGSDTNCEWAVSVEGGRVDGLSVTMNTNYADGCRVINGADGSMRVVTKTSPANTTALKLGDSGGASINGFAILPGSEIQSGTTAVDFANCNQSTVEPSRIRGDIVFAAASTENVIYIPRDDAQFVTFTNNNTSFTNTIILRGSYTLADLNGINGSAPFRGMYAEQCRTFGWAPAYYNGTAWVPASGLLKSGTVTVSSGSTQGTDAHGLGFDPSFEQIDVKPTSAWGSATQWWIGATATNVAVNVDVDPGTDITFSYRISTNEL